MSPFRTIVRLCLTVALTASPSAAPVHGFAELAHGVTAHETTPQEKQTGTIAGEAKDAKGQLIPGARVRIRDAATGAVAAETVATSTGTFSVAGLTPATYVAEIVNATGEVIGVSSAVAVIAGATTTVTVTTTAVGAIAAAASGGGFSILGLGTAASLAVAAVTTTAAIIGLVAAENRPTASPSQ